MTPTFRAAAAGEMSVLRYLLDHGGDPAIPDAMGFMPLHIAAENGARPDPFVVFDVECVCAIYCYLSEPLCAYNSGHIEVVRLLLSEGVDADPLNNRLVSPLPCAAAKGHSQIVKLLLERGADVSYYLRCDLSSIGR
jgi:ankyrin repeat protein